MDSQPFKGKSEVVPKPTLGQFVLAEKLGSGSYATVYKAFRKTGPREVVAIKCVLKSSLNKASTENLLSEIQLLRDLKHEHIVQLKDFQWDHSYIYLIMEYCSGGDLFKFIRCRRALPENVVKRFLQQLASAMKYLWDKNVAHMDLKPQNILLTATSNPQIKIADFGFAKHLYDGDNLHVMRGSPLYMAPEIICKGVYDNRVDLWSLGVILFECIFGKAPFASKTFQELGEKIWNIKPVEIPPGFDLSDEARDLVIRLLQRDPDKRITFEEFFVHKFVDLEHAPSKNSLTKAISIVTDAVKKDKEGDYKSSIRLYCEALEFFIPAIHYEKNIQKKESIRAKVREYMGRAEVLKHQIKPGRSLSNISSQPTAQHSETKDNLADSRSKTEPKVNPDNKVVQRSLSAETLEEIMLLFENSQEFLAVLKVVKAALLEEENEDLKQALHHYEVALGAVIKLLPGEPKGKRKDLINFQVKQWMTKAEQIKAYLEIQSLNTTDTSAQEEANEQTFLGESKQCCIQ